MNTKIVLLCAFAFFAVLRSTYAYPPAVGIVGKARNCIECHDNNGPWLDDEKTIIDIIDKQTKKSLKQKDGTFLISVKRNEEKTVLTIIGRTKDADDEEVPYRNAWLYIDPSLIETKSTESKFAPGWAVDLQMSCRLVGDELDEYKGARITVAPMTIRPTDNAKDAEIELQVMITTGEAVKGNAKVGMSASYFERKVRLKVIQEQKENIITGEGTIKYIDLEGGFYGIVDDSGNKYDAHNLDQEFKVDGLQVSFEAEIDKDSVCIHMWGTPVKIIKIEKLK